MLRPRGPEEIPDCAGWIRGGHHGAHYGTAGDSSPEDMPGEGGRDATDAYYGRARAAHHPGQAIETDSLTGIQLGTGRENGAATDVVRAIGHSRASGVLVVGGVADEEARWCDAAGGGDREVTGPEVDAVGTDGQSQIDPVVYEEEAARGCGIGAQALGQGEDFARGQGLLAQLHGRRARAQSGTDHLSDIPGTGEDSVGDHD